MDTKICSKCKSKLPIDQFRERMKYGKKTRQSFCIECNKQYSANWYKKNKQNVLSGNIKSRKRNQKFIIEYLRSHSCVDCGNNDNRVLDFDHVNGDKINSISHMVRGGYAINTIKEEIEKCEVRCANCHRIKTGEEFGWFDKM